MITETILQAVIVDDEARGREGLRRLLSIHCPRIRVEAECGSVAEAVAALERSSPDVVFLDIELPDGTGFDILQRTRSETYRTIITTAHDTYAIRAIRSSALDFLVKPIVGEELVEAVRRAEEQVLSQEARADQLRLLGAHMRGADHGRIAVPTAEGLRFLELSMVIRCQAHGNYTEFVLADRTHLLVSHTLKNYDELLSDRGFFRIHHAHVINLLHVRRYLRGKGGIVVMSDGTELEVAVRRKEEFLSLWSSL